MNEKSKMDEQEKNTRIQACETGDEDVCTAVAELAHGNPRAEFFLGMSHDFGEHGLARDAELAKYWYERAACHGDAEAQTNLGHMYAHGRGGPVDGEKAIGWYKIAAQSGSCLAMGNLAYLYLEGIFMEKPNPELAVRLYEKAIRLGADEGGVYLYDLGSCYERGKGTAKNLEKAVALYKKAAAADSGLARQALRRLGVVFEERKPQAKAAPNRMGSASAAVSAGKM